VTEHREIELKLEIDPAALQQLRDDRAKAIAAAEESRQRLSSVYFDTSKFRLRQAGFTLRVRAEGNRRLQTVKYEGHGTAGLFERPEWTVEIESDEPDLSQIKDTPLDGAVSARRLRGRLRPVFWTEIERTTWRIISRAAEVEMVLDEGRVVADGRTEPIAEVELELKAGSSSELFKLARALGPETGLRLGVLSKSERGYALAAGDAPASFRADPIILQPDMSTADAFKRIVAACIRHFRLNEPRLIAMRAAEPLHQCRVALRRLRTALSVFRDVIADDEFEKLRDRLRALSQKLGEARDLDVLLANLHQPHDEQPAGELDRGQLIAQAQDDRERAYDRLIAALEGKRFRTLMFDLLAWSEAGPWLRTDDAAAQPRRQRPIASFAAEELRRRRRKIRKRGRHLAQLNPPDRHRVRIATKKLRYATEFFASLATRKKAQRRRQAFTKALEALQEHLGELNDLAAHDTIVTDAARREGKPTGSASDSNHADGEGAHRGPQRAHERALTAARRAFRSFADAKAFWTGSFSATHVATDEHASKDA
jgi:triphosphatase